MNGQEMLAWLKAQTPETLAKPLWMVDDLDYGYPVSGLIKVNAENIVIHAGDG